jgi:hypothetical protein
MTGTAPNRFLLRKRTTVADRVREWFAQFPGQCFCVECVVKETGLEKILAARGTKRICETGLGSQYRAKCSFCGELKTITVLNVSI